MIVNNKLLIEDDAKIRYPHLGKLFCLSSDFDPATVTPIDVYYSLYYNVENFSLLDRKMFMFDSSVRWDEHYNFGQYGEVLIENEKDIDERFFAKENLISDSEGEKKSKKKKGNDIEGNTSDIDDDEGDETYEEIEISKIKKTWQKRIEFAFGTVKKSGGKGVGFEEDFANLKLEKLKEAQLDWKTILNDALSNEICDYSFTPVDKRYSDSDFFLPDFNETDTVVKDVLFMVDTSGSIDIKALTVAFSEIKGAIEQFKGKLTAKLGFFDYHVKKVVDFDTVDDLMKIKPIGGGGTDFFSVFEYVEKLGVEQISQIIILTDGEAPYPDEEMAKGIPVLWLINNKKETPPWGKIARIIVK